jgi:hypothetical protein
MIQSVLPDPCSVCKDATSSGNEAVNESLDNFNRFYFRPMKPIFERHQSCPEPETHHSYRYKPLLDRAYTRLLIVRPGQGDDVILCGLEDMDIDDPPRYTALSYTWGSWDDGKTIDVEGHRFSVTNNLWHALWHIRSKDQVLPLWVDASK